MDTLFTVLLEHPVPVAALVIAAFLYAWHRYVLLPAERALDDARDEALADLVAQLPEETPVIAVPKETRRLTGLGEVLSDREHAEIHRLVRKGGRR